MAVTKKDYICSIPFTQLEIYSHERTLCCPAWLKKNLPENSTPEEAWTSIEANEIRESILDGSYKFCDALQCPHLGQIESSQKSNESSSGYFRALHHRDNLPTHVLESIDKYKSNKLSPSTVHFSFDSTCNLKCPSCRVKLITASKKEIELINSTVNLIQKQYGEHIETLYITGTGDPFVSVGFRKFLREFNPSLWPRLTKIHLHTNATKWNKEMWESMGKIHKYVKTCEISIDAGSKDTYENKTRIGGNWEELIDNLHFISSIKELKSIKLSFVVQESNYTEIQDFYNLMNSIFKRKATIFFGKLNNWGTYTEEEYTKQAVHIPTHPKYNEVRQELNKVLPIYNAWTNLNELVELTPTLI